MTTTAGDSKVHACSKCGGPATSFAPQPDVSVRICRRCKGVQLPRGHMARLLRTSTDLGVGDAGGGGRATKHRCEVCQSGSLMALPYDQNGSVTVDRCDTCGSIFLDDKELGQLQRLVGSRPKTPAKSPAAAAAPIPDREAAAIPESGFFVRQRREWTEVFLNFETRNKYDVYDGTGRQILHVAEQNHGFLAWVVRQLLGTHRPLNLAVSDANRRPVLWLTRPFFFLFSDMDVTSVRSQRLGSVRRRWAWFHTIYDLRDADDTTFARVKKPFWRIWRFPVMDDRGVSKGEILKRWSGFFNEMFTSSDTFQISFAPGSTWSPARRMVMLAAALTVDLDWFEIQSKGGGSSLDLVSGLTDVVTSIAD